MTKLFPNSSSAQSLGDQATPPGTGIGESLVSGNAAERSARSGNRSAPHTSRVHSKKYPVHSSEKNRRRVQRDRKERRKGIHPRLLDPGDPEASRQEHLLRRGDAGRALQYRR